MTRMTETRSVRVRVSADVSDLVRGYQQAGREGDAALGKLTTGADRARDSVGGLEAEVSGLGAEVRRSSAEIDRFSGRLSLARDAILTLGPASIPIASLAIPAVTGLANGLGISAVAAGTAAAAFQGVGDALKAVREYELEPTTANFEKAQAAMANISPTAQALVLQLRDMGPALRAIRDTAATRGLDGVIAGLESIEDVLPRVRRLTGAYADTLGDLAADAGASLASDRWADFLAFLHREGPSTLRDTATALGDITHGLSEMWEAFDPLNDDFGNWLVDSADKFDAFASGLDQSRGLEEFLDYVEENGPKAADALGSIADASIEIVEAAAPLGGPVLQGITALADTVATIADSDAGTVLFTAAAGMAAFNRASRLWTAASGVGPLQRNIVGPINDIKKNAPSLGQVGTYFQYLGQHADHASKKTLAARNSVRGFAKSVVPASAAAAGLGLVATGAADGLGATNTVSLALAGTLMGPWGIALGAAVGGLIDLRASARDTTDEVSELNAAIAAGDTARAAAELRQLGDEITNSSMLSGGLEGAWSKLSGRQKVLIEEYWRHSDALRDMQGAAGEVGNIGDLLGDPMEMAGKFRRAAMSIEEFAQSFSALNTLLNTSGTLLAYEAALDQLTDSLEENGDAWKAGTEAGRANLAARNVLVGQAIERSNALKEAGDELGSQRILTRAINDLQDFAQESPEARAAMRPFIRELRQLNGEEARPKVSPDTKRARSELEAVGRDLDRVGRQRPTPKVGADTGRAKQEIDGVFANLFRLDRQNPSPDVSADTGGAEAAIGGVFADLIRLDGTTATTYVRVVTDQITNVVRNILPRGLSPFGSADGGTVPRTGLPYADRHLYLLADGEEVISNRRGQADRHRPLLKAINAGRLAEGGTARRALSAISSPYWGERTGDKDRFLQSEVRDGLRSFSINLGDSARDVRREFSELRRTIREAGGEVSDQFERVADRAASLAGRLERSQRALDRERESRQELVQDRNQYRSEVRSSFDNDMFGNGLAGLRLQLRADRSDSRAMLSAVRRADRKGLSGGLEKALIASGDLTTAQQLARLSRGQIAGYERLFSQTSQARSALGAFGGQEIYGAELRASRRAVAKLERTVDRLDKKLDRVRGDVRDGAREGTQRGMTDRSRSTAQRGRAGR